MKLSPIFLLILLLSCANVQTATKKIITIEPHLSFQNYEHFKRLTLNSPDSPVEYLNDFDFEWGYRYQLSVTETPLKATLSDGTQYEYKLNRIVSKTKMPDSSRFQLYIDANRYYSEVEESDASMNATLVKIDEGAYRYFDEVTIEVPESLRADFEAYVSGDKTGICEFMYLDPDRIQLVKM